MVRREIYPNKVLNLNWKKVSLIIYGYIYKVFTEFDCRI
jgi:hypothetical protein